MTFDTDAHDQIVNWMRARGVSILEVDGLKIVLGPEPKSNAPQTEEQRVADQINQRRRELDILFSATSVRPRKQ